MARALIPAAETEALPEPDRLDSFPAPRETKRLYGQDGAEAAFASAFQSGRLHHGWLITGPAGVGKATLAYRIARFLLAAPSERDMFGSSLEIDPATQASRLVTNLAHPELLVIRRPYDFKNKKLKSEITVDEVRKLKSFLSGSAPADGWRVVIVDPADDLNISAANALLKSLEEPPRQTVFLLAVSAPDRLLPTIRSRCRTLDCQPLATEPLKKAVTQAMSASSDDVSASMPSGAEWNTLEQLAQGSVRRILMLHAAKGLELNARTVALVSALPKPDWADVHVLGDELGSPAAETRYELFFDMFLGLLARLIRAAAVGDTATDEGRLAARLIPADRLAAWAQLWETTVTEKADADALNLDRKALILGAFQRLAQLSRGTRPT